MARFNKTLQEELQRQEEERLRADAFGNVTSEPETQFGTNPRGVEYTRETFQWGSFGRNGDEPLRQIILKDISDSHLVHIIGHLILTNSADTLIIMLEEARFRSQHNIYVEDYNNTTDDVMNPPVLPF